MRLVVEWHAAAVVTEDGVQVDLLVWDGRGGVAAAAERLDAVGAGRLTPEAKRLRERFEDAVPSPALPADHLPRPSEELLAVLDAAALLLAERGVADAAGDLDRRIEHLQRAMEEVRLAANLQGSRFIEWLGLFLSDLDLDQDRVALARTFAAAEDLGGCARGLGLAPPLHVPARAEWRSLRDLAVSIVEVQGRLDRLEAALRTLVEEHLPSLSRLVGPLLAAKLCVTAGGRNRLARLPSSTVQVLGAEQAFFAHLRTGSPPPKHGHLFGHPWVKRSPHWVRGKVARMLAGRCSIAARLDAYGGHPITDEDVKAVEAKVEAIRVAHKSPPARRG